jgi:hypothetical protein
MLDTESLAVCTRILEAVNRGSDAHVSGAVIWHTLTAHSLLDDRCLHESTIVCAYSTVVWVRCCCAQVYLAAEYMVRAGVRFGDKHHEAKEVRQLARFNP